ncbi:MAG TPA: hypothetical protein VGJ48_08925 [Pyrinomonadaceae bacterium]
MANSKKTPVTFQELLVSSPRPIGRAGEAPHREGHHHAAGVLAEDFRGEGDLSTDAQSYGAMNI